MTYSVSLPLSGYSGWTFLKRTQDRQMAALAKDPQVTRDEAYFRSRIQGATTAEALVKDKRLLRVALRAFGLEGDVGKTYFITKVLAEGTADGSLRAVEDAADAVMAIFGAVTITGLHHLVRGDDIPEGAAAGVTALLMHGLAKERR